MIINTGLNNTSAEVNAILTELMTEVNTLMTDLRSDVDSLMADLSNTVANSVGVVKSVQRGALKPTGTGAPNVTININAVNPDKCMVLLNGSLSAGNEATYAPTLVALTATSFTVTWSGGWNDPRNFSWQVIEFY